jgi:Peroxidase/Ankyrin repeats (3 copies)
MRFEPEKSDPANAGLHIVRAMLHEVHQKHPHISLADLWTFAGCKAVKFMGGPDVPFRFGRTDDPDGSHCPMPGRLPDAAQGAEHLRDVFGRMGFDDRGIVALSGGHTVGRAHRVRSGFDGPWTSNPLRFDNEYFRNLIERTWVKKEWDAGYDGPLQYTDAETKTLLMLPTDVALVSDAKFRVFVELYARDEQIFFNDFADAFAKLVSLGCPAHCDPSVAAAKADAECPRERASAQFREFAMHGSLGEVKRLAAGNADAHALEPASNRSALHKAAFWGHVDTVRFLANDAKLDVNVVDVNGDTALHDAVRHDHPAVVRILLEANTDLAIKNKKGRTPYDTAIVYEKPELAQLIKEYEARAKL